MIWFLNKSEANAYVAGSAGTPPRPAGRSDLLRPENRPRTCQSAPPSTLTPSAACLTFISPVARPHPFLGQEPPRLPGSAAFPVSQGQKHICSYETIHFTSSSSFSIPIFLIILDTLDVKYDEQYL